MYIANTGIISCCTIVSNYASGQGGGIYDNDGYCVNFDNCLIYFNEGSGSNYFPAAIAASFTNCCLSPALTGATTNYSTNNIIADPQFVDWQGGNYRLNQNSPCVNAGVNRDWMNGAVDLDGHSRLDHYSRIVDMGCFEYLPAGSMYRLGF
jgi:hypothetical protein